MCVYAAFARSPYSGSEPISLAKTFPVEPHTWPRTLANLRAAAAGEVIAAREWHLGSHTLKGSARAVGAWRVAQLAETAEADQSAGRSVLMAHVAALETAIEEVAAHVADLKRQAEAAG